MKKPKAKRKSPRPKSVSRPSGPHSPTPILMTGLWHELSNAQRAKLTALNFDEHSWNNNVREKVTCDEFEVHVGGERVPQRFSVMTGDRARSTAHAVALYEIGANF